MVVLRVERGRRRREGSIYKREREKRNRRRQSSSYRRRSENVGITEVEGDEQGKGGNKVVIIEGGGR